MAQKGNNVPRHVAIIMDGNGRWAMKRGFERTEGHLRGAKTFQDIVKYVVRKTDVNFLTAYGFAINNNDRNPLEVSAINNEACRLAITLAGELQQNNVMARAVGDLADVRVPQYLRSAIRVLEQATVHCTGLKLQIAWNYSGKNEIERAHKAGFDVGLLYQTMLDARDVPPIDLVIRSGVDNDAGLNFRLSDFFPLLSANAVCVPLTTMWPDMKGKDIEYAMSVWRREPHLNGGQRIQY